MVENGLLFTAAKWVYHPQPQPVEAIKNAYKQMGRAFDPDHEQAILRYLSEKPKGKFGKHDYTPEDWGFDSEGLRAYSKTYMECYGIKAEE